MGKTKIFLVLAIILGTVAIAGVLIFIASTNPPKTATENSSQAELLGQETQSEEVKPKPHLELFSQPVSISIDGNNFKPAAANQEITVGSKIKTEKGGRAQIVYPNKSVTRIDENTQITVEKLEANNNFAGSIKIESGKIWSRVAKLLGTESYETKTNSTVAAIRGTSFGHSIDSSKSQDIIISFRNNVLGKCLNKSQQASVAQNTKGIFNCKTDSKPQINNLTPKDMADPWLNFNKTEDEKLDKLNGTATYGDKPIVLGASATPSPSSSPTNTPASTSTASPTATATPSPTPDNTPTIFKINFDPLNCNTDYCQVTIEGNNLTDQALVHAVDKNKPASTPILASSTDFKRLPTITAVFNGLPIGDFLILIRINNTNIYSTDYFSIQQ